MGHLPPVVYVSYEPAPAAFAGLGAVNRLFPRHLQDVSGRTTLVLAPFHRNLPGLTGLSLQPVASVAVFLAGERVQTDVLRGEIDGVSHCFLRPSSGDLFSGVKHPYDVPADRLRRDAVLFGVAGARALEAMGLSEGPILLCDWPGLCFALAAGPRTLSGARAVLHNVYDAPVGDDELGLAGIDPASCPGPQGESRATVLVRALRRMSGPIVTVSEGYASDLQSDVLHTNVLVPHLQSLLRQRGVVGIPNGPFLAKPAVPEAVLARATSGEVAAVREWKRMNRAKFREALAAFDAGSLRWGDASRIDLDRRPLLVAGGRNDHAQKGLDLVSAAIDQALLRGLDASFVLFPIPGEDGLQGLDFLEALARKWPARVLVLPENSRALWFSGLQAAAATVMASTYEPFGSAGEASVLGTPSVARATGGLVEQVVPLMASAAFSPAVAERTERFHGRSACPTGVLFREPPVATEAEDWRVYIDGARDAQTRAQRLRLPLFRAIVGELESALADAVYLARHEERLYQKMLVEGVDFVSRSFSWRRAARQYMRVLAP